MTEDGFKSSWNISGGLAEQIDGLLREATDYYIKGEFHLAWKRLKAITQRIVQLLNEDDEKQLNDLCNITCNHSKGSNPILASIYYDKLNSKIMRILHEKGLLLQGKKDGTHMKF